MKNKTKQIVMGAIIFLLLPMLVSAQGTNTSEDKNTGSKLVADVNLSKASIESQQGSKFSIKFTLDNGQGVQPNVKYGIKLVNIRNEQAPLQRQTIIDERIYNESFTLEENSSVNRKIKYSAPAHLQGNFELWLSIKNSSGLSLGTALLETITLEGSGEFIDLKEGTCYLTVSGDKSQYHSIQGIDIDSKNEQLFLNCEAENKFNKEVEFSPSFETYQKSSFGEKVTVENTRKRSFILTPSETKEISFQIPLPEEPQTYETKMTLLNSAGKVISNLAVLQYVIRGGSATIHNVQTDKITYQKGDQANLLLFWSPSLDSFPGSRLGETKMDGLTLDILMVDEAGGNCIEPIRNRPLDVSKSVMEITVPIVKSCQNFKVIVAVKDKEGRSLDEQKFLVSKGTVAKQQPQKVSTKDDAKKKAYLILAMIFIGIILIVLLVMVAIKNKSIKMLWLLFLPLIWLAGAEKAEAWTAVVDMPGQSGSVAFTVTANVHDAETARVWVNAIYTGPWSEINVSATVCGRTKDLNIMVPPPPGPFDIPMPCPPGAALFDCPVNCDLNTREVGMYWEKLVNGRWHSVSASRDITYDGPPCADCGAADGQSFQDLLATDPALCDPGEVLNFEETPNGWTWLCTEEIFAQPQQHDPPPPVIPPGAVECSASKVGGAAACGTAVDTDQYILLETDPTLCNPGMVSSFEVLANGWTWWCEEEILSGGYQHHHPPDPPDPPIIPSGTVQCSTGFAEMIVTLVADPDEHIHLNIGDLPVSSDLTWTANNVDSCTVGDKWAVDYPHYNPLIISPLSHSGGNTGHPFRVTMNSASASGHIYSITCRNIKNEEVKEQVAIRVRCDHIFGEWSGCSSVCGSGLKYRDVQLPTCTITTDDDYCNNGDCGSGWTER